MLKTRKNYNSCNVLFLIFNIPSSPKSLAVKTIGISIFFFLNYSFFTNESFGQKQSLIQPMQFAGHSLARIQSFVVTDPKKIKNLKPIIQETKNISKFIDHVQKTAEVDPSFYFILKRMGNEIKIATKSLKNKDIRTARHILSRISGFCISCHTRTAKGRQFDFTKTTPNFGNKDHFFKANFMAATRQFDRAIEHYEYFLADKNLASTRPKVWQLAIRRLLAITVRVKQSPSLTMEMVSALLDRKAIPRELLEEIRTWRLAAKTWRQEKTNQKKSVVPLIQAQNLIQKGKQYQKTTFGLVEFLRASTLLHKFLDDEKSRKNIGEALYWSGVAAGSLDDINFWTMDDYYYEACIRLKGNSFARKCFEGYINTQIKTFGQEADIPSHIKTRLQKLKQLARF